MRATPTLDPCPPTPPVTVAIVVDVPLLRLGVQHVLQLDPGLRVVDSVGSLTELADAGPAEVTVLGMSSTPIGALPGIRGLARRGAVLVLLPVDAEDVAAAIVHAGVAGCLSMSVPAAWLTNAVRKIAAGERILPLTPRAKSSHGLGARELETLRLLADGLTHRQIGRRMGLTEATVSTYVKRIRAKLNAGNKAVLTRRAIELAGVDPGGCRDPDG